MTAINVFRDVDAIHMITDGIAHVGDRPSFVTGKAWPLPHVNAVSAVSGPAAAAGLMVSVMGAATSYDELKAYGALEARSAFKEFRKVLELSTDPTEVRIVIAGFSEKGGADSFVISSKAAPEVPEWSAVTLPPIFGVPMDEDNAISKAWLSAFPTAYDALAYPAEAGILLLELQRSSFGTAFVGGFAQMTTVTREAVTSRIIHRWPA
jgi:hypothetical protein